MYSARKENIAPIAFFVFNRPDHTLKTLKALDANRDCYKKDLYIFCDAPRNTDEVKSTQKVKEIVESFSGFENIHRIYQSKNKGLYKSITGGISQVLENHETVIHLEDDIEVLPEFLTFMNEALVYYKDNPNVCSVSGDSLHKVSLPENYTEDGYFFYRSSSWGMGTWKKYWEEVPWKTLEGDKFLTRKNFFKIRKSGDDLLRFWSMHKKKQIQSWATLWSIYHTLQDNLTLYASKPLLRNIGMDGSGTHCTKNQDYDHLLMMEKKRDYQFPKQIEISPSLKKQMENFEKYPLSRVIRWFLKEYYRKITT
jgi:hypothetical protein